MSLVVFGDLHFSDERAWSVSVGKAFIDFLDKCEDNNPNNVGVFLGDITEKASVSPFVYDLLFKFLSCLRLKETIILEGNHDKKKRRGQIIRPLSFLLSKDSPYPNVHLITEPTLLEKENIPLVLLPFRGITEVPSMSDYSEKLDPEWYTKTDALILGHFADKSNESVKDNLINLSNFQGEILLGHIHNPVSKHYIGSVVPNAYSEKKVTRYYRVYTSNKKVVKKVIPSILDYVDVKFPEPLPKTEAKISVYTITNCKNSETALSYYGNMFIRKCVNEDTVDIESLDKVLATSSEESLYKMVEGWLKIQASLSDKTKKKILKYLTA